MSASPAPKPVFCLASGFPYIGNGSELSFSRACALISHQFKSANHKPASTHCSQRPDVRFAARVVMVFPLKEDVTSAHAVCCPVSAYLTDRKWRNFLFSKFSKQFKDFLRHKFLLGVVRTAFAVYPIASRIFAGRFSPNLFPEYSLHCLSGLAVNTNHICAVIISCSKSVNNGDKEPSSVPASSHPASASLQWHPDEKFLGKKQQILTLRCKDFLSLIFMPVKFSYWFADICHMGKVQIWF